MLPFVLYIDDKNQKQRQFLSFYRQRYSFHMVMLTLDGSLSVFPCCCTILLIQRAEYEDKCRNVTSASSAHLNKVSAGLMVEAVL